MPAGIFRLYLVTDRAHTRGRPLLDVIEAALAGGVDAVQLREKNLPARDLLALALRLGSLCRRYGARLLINDRIDVALAAGADGVHLPGNSFQLADARHLLGPSALIGVSTHSLTEARAAAEGGADFIVFGPVFDTPSKRSFGLPPVGLDALAEATRGVSLPVFAIGGVSVDGLDAVCERGVHGIAAIAALLQAEDPRAAAEQIRLRLERFHPR
jgi:thiamine-phosphate pyrophosphorylase